MPPLPSLSWRAAAIPLGLLTFLAACDSAAAPTTPATLEIAGELVLDAARPATRLDATVFDDEGGPVEVVVQWASSDPSVATVDSGGVVRAVDNGVTAITATAGQASAEVSVRVFLSDGWFACDCAAGVDADCEAGDDAASGRSPYTAHRSYDAARSDFARLAAGDSLYLCAGGAFEATGDNTDRRWLNDRCRADEPCTVTSYAPPWGAGDEERPLIVASSGHGISLEDGGDADHEEGYVFERLRLACPGCSDSFGFFLYNDVDDVLIRDVEIDGFAVGVYSAESNPCGTDPECNGRNDRLTLRRLRIVNATSQGFLGSAYGLVIEDSYFENNGERPILDHNIYVAGEGADLRITGNELYRAAPDADGACDGVSLVVHGVQTGVVIEDNLVREDVGKANPRCWGIAVDPGYTSPERFEDVVIRRNRVIDVGNVGIGVASCVGCVIENNIVVNRQPFHVTGIAAPDRDAEEGDAAQTDVDVRNNSIYIGGTGGAGIVRGGLGAGNLVVSNAIVYGGTDPAWYCMEIGVPDGADPAAVYDAVGHNLCWAPSLGGAMAWERYAGTDPDPLTAWQSAHGLGDGSVWADPLFADPAANDLAPAAGSPLLDAGSPDHSAAEDVDEQPRDADPDIGAHEGSG